MPERTHVSFAALVGCWWLRPERARNDRPSMAVGSVLHVTLVDDVLDRSDERYIRVEGAE